MNECLNPTLERLPDGTSTQAISVLLVDDNRTLLRVLARFLVDASQGEVAVVGTVEDSREAVMRAAILHPDVILLDLQMPHIGGQTLLPRLRARVPEAIILILTSQDDPAVRRAMLALGADGFVSKTNITDDLLPTLQGLVAVKRSTKCAA